MQTKPAVIKKKNHNQPSRLDASIHYLMKALACFLVFTPKTISTTQIKEHHGPGRAQTTGVTQRSLFPCYTKTHGIQTAC